MSTRRPNILFLMADQMQGRVLEPEHPCRTPVFDALAARGVRIQRAYAPSATCSPSRASLMTGLLPHTHGVLEVTHVVDEDQCVLRERFPHWAQRLRALGYRTGYFGKWHVERSGELERFGWEVNGATESPWFREHARQVREQYGEGEYLLSRSYTLPPGYRKGLFYGVTTLPPAARRMGIITDLAYRFLESVLDGPDPWCCFVSVPEPHDPFVCGEEAFRRYDVDAVELPPNFDDALEGRPNIYRKAARAWADVSEREHREAAVCYWASITEIDEQFGRLLELLEVRGAIENTIVVLTSDHGELLGAHGLYCKNFSAFEEVYHIPMVLAGPGVAVGEAVSARVGLHDLAPTLLELVGAEPIGEPESRSFAPLLTDPKGQADRFQTGYAEYFGGRYRLTQRVIWEGDWKLVWNGFDFDELYHLAEDPWELHNRIDDPACDPVVRRLMRRAWQIIRDTGDHSLWNSHYPPLRVAPYGPGILHGEGTD